MQTIQADKFKAEFSAILEQIQNTGEKFVIEYGKQHKKVAMLVPYEDEIKRACIWAISGKSYCAW